MTCLPAHEKSWALIHSLLLEVVQQGLGKKTRLVHEVYRPKILNIEVIFLVILLHFLVLKWLSTFVRASNVPRTRGWKYYTKWGREIKLEFILSDFSKILQHLKTSEGHFFQNLTLQLIACLTHYVTLLQLHGSYTLLFSKARLVSWLPQISLYKIPWLFLNKNKISLTIEIQNVNSSSGFFFHSLITCNNFQQFFLRH